MLSAIPAPSRCAVPPVCTTRLLPQRVGRVSSRHVPFRPAENNTRRVKTSALQEVGWMLSEAAAGSVEAPPFVLPLAAFIMVIVGGGSAILLKPGDDAARDMRSRDSKKWNNYDE